MFNFLESRGPSEPRRIVIETKVHFTHPHYDLSAQRLQRRPGTVLAGFHRTPCSCRGSLLSAPTAGTDLSHSAICHLVQGPWRQTESPGCHRDLLRSLRPNEETQCPQTHPTSARTTVSSLICSRLALEPSVYMLTECIYANRVYICCTKSCEPPWEPNFGKVSSLGVTKKI